MENDFLKRAEEILPEMIAHRRYFHENAELGTELPKTVAYVTKELKDLGYDPIPCGTCGLVALAGGKKPGKVIIVRGDMDALPITEETGLPFSSKTPYMHACGHDMHTAGLLGVAKLLKEHEDEIEGTVKLMFQPDEEGISGAKLMIENGLLENPKVDAAIGAHVFAGQAGGILSNFMGNAMASSDIFAINIYGRGGHGSMPEITIDPINVGVHIHLALQTIISREVSGLSPAVLTVGKFKSGEIGNVIPDNAVLEGTIRTFDKDVREKIRTRLVEVSQQVGQTFGAKVEVVWKSGCPSLYTEPNLVKEINGYLQEVLTPAGAIIDESKMMGSEDFAYVAEKVPSAFIGVFAKRADWDFTAHHTSKVDFDESVLAKQAAGLAYAAISWLKNNK